MHQLKLRCVIVDDEPLAIEKMVNYASKVPFLEVEKTFSNGLEALDYIKSNKIDLLLLDVQMEDITGIQLLEIMKDKPYVVLTTAYDQFALKGYELDVNDYLLKPISFERFLKAVHRIYDLAYSNTCQAPPLEAPAEIKPKGPGFMFVKTEYRMQKVNFDDIFYIEGMKDYLRIVMQTERIMTLTNFKSIIEMLPADCFIRIHKSFVINICKIDGIERHHVIINKERLAISENYRKSFFDMLDNLKLMNNKISK
ncbi:MAG: LytTR family DNA-binding domain-containing protein [Bacteroidota bacterium]